MQPMGKLPAVGAKPLIKVFRCYECNHIAWDSQEAASPGPARLVSTNRNFAVINLSQVPFVG
jgi:hypothetical protein